MTDYYYKIGDQVQALEEECERARNLIGVLVYGSKMPSCEWKFAAEELPKSIRRMEYRLKRIKEIRSQK